ncbi:hypothetical protein SCHPADRAFT_811323, partial [Schizopora paradoxa]
LFRNPKFRSRILDIVVDEAHVIQQWGDDFRKSFKELTILKTIAGTEVPWSAFSATLPTPTFHTVFNTLRMGENKRFWGTNVGCDRKNLELWVRPMEYPIHSLA